MIAVGIGCRKECDPGDIVQAIASALAASRSDLRAVHALYAPEFKREERSLVVAAQEVGKDLVYLPLDALRAQASLALTMSAHVLERWGLPSVAEAAALAGAGCLRGIGGQRLLGPRQIAGGAACALAVRENST
jgi:cobalt-precorrin 5A hydrolase